MNSALEKNSTGKLRTRVIRILFNVCADADNYNAQSLNAREIALRLDAARFESTLFFERSPDTRLLRVGIRTVKLPERRKTIRILREMLGRYDFIVYIDLSPASYIYLHLPRLLRRGTKSVLCMEGPRGNLDGVSATVRKYADYAVRHADLRTAVSEFVAQDACDFIGIKPDMIMPVGVDAQVFSPPVVRNRQVATILFVGHLIERKGAHLVYDAAKRLPQARFRLIGNARDGFGRELLSEHEKAKLPNVSIEKPVPQPQLAEAMRESDIFILPSRIEGMPKVTLEAAATGLPCIVFGDYKTPSVADGVTGFQVETFEQMLDRLQLLIQDADLRRRMSAAAISHAKQFDWDHVVAQWEATFDRELRRDLCSADRRPVV
jgi:glycosyltransferase involved in cell wall biosynthesis